MTAFIEKNEKVVEYKDKLKEYLDKREQTAIMINEEMAER